MQRFLFSERTPIATSVTLIAAVTPNGPLFEHFWCRGPFFGLVVSMNECLASIRVFESRVELEK